MIADGEGKHAAEKGVVDDGVQIICTLFPAVDAGLVAELIISGAYLKLSSFVSPVSVLCRCVKIGIIESGVPVEREPVGREITV